ncbi:MAG: glycosyltransferase family 2 protein [Pirellulaceae bacterium]|jgi:glycosyltransferase involved in cell wall biosynthesis|nr:glycosyltransferase family 2 protein [Pirellulaceae bacterium]MCU0980057.1 glycosyltransferase family 2 protein [Pirellulaceae bacterium]
MLSLSVVVPIYNEFENIPLLYEQLSQTLPQLGREYEILFVDDGSRDGSVEALQALAAVDPRVKVVRFRRNYGQTAAMQAGFQYASCDVIVTMDGDLQNDPSDIAMLLAKIDEGYDLVHGWRKQRHDAFLNRRLPSLIANWIISKTTRFPIHDLGCTLKAIRREIAQDLELFGEMHRFIPILAHWRGARCAELVTKHHPRRFGQTKYGISRTLRVVLDLITVKYMLDYSASPMKLFGMLGFGCGLLSALAGVAVVLMKLAQGVDMTGNPLLLLAVFAMMVGVQLLSLGLLGEVSARIYFGSQDKQHFTVRELINFESPGEPFPRRAKAA